MINQPVASRKEVRQSGITPEMIEEEYSRREEEEEEASYRDVLAEVCFVHTYVYKYFGTVK